MAAGIDGLFMEVHPDPDSALCDGPNSWPLDEVEKLLQCIMTIHKCSIPCIEDVCIEGKSEE